MEIADRSACGRWVHREIIFYKTIEGRQKMAETKQGEQQDQARIKTLVVLTTDSAGKGNDDLGRNIVTNFIKTMKEMGDDLWRLVLLNGGVKLAVEGAEVLPQLQALAHEGLDILVCESCLKTFGLLEKKRVGEVTNMLDIVTSMQVAEKVISFA
ncbi:MAG: sulfurtransferase-like selenium metabolism protein YedF [Syntrophobacteraceae bacterium]